MDSSFVQESATVAPDTYLVHRWHLSFFFFSRKNEIGLPNYIGKKYDFQEKNNIADYQFGKSYNLDTRPLHQIQIVDASSFMST